MADVVDRGAVQPLDAVTTRVRAANPSPMTLTGTNTYIVGDATGGDVVVVDPGPPLPEHRAAIDAAVAARRCRIANVIVTHHHDDHAGAVAWAHEWGVDAFAGDPARVPGTRSLEDGVVIHAGAVRLAAHHLPGHTSDHVCLRIPDTQIVLTGDHVLGHGTTVIAWPDGDLDAYLTSLHGLRALAPVALYPGHGDVIAAPDERIEALLAHRHERTRQICAALDEGADTVDAIVSVVYADLATELRPAAARSVGAHLAALATQGRVVEREGRWHGQ